MNAKKAAAMIAIKADSKGLERDLSAAKKMLRMFGADTKRIGGKLWGAGSGALKSIGAGIGLSAGLGLADMAREALDFDKSLTRIQVAASMSDSSLASLRASLLQTSRDTATAKEEILAGGQAYLAATGDAKGLVDMMQLLAKTAQATGAKTNDLAQVAAKLRDNFKIDNVTDMERALSGLIQQGKAGSVELSDLAANIASVAPQFADFGSVGGVAGVAELGAAMQVVAKGFNTASDGATGLRSMMTGLVQNADRFEKAGVRIFDKDPKTGAKTMRNFSAIWHDINTSKLVKDPKLLGDAFGREEARRAYDQLKKYGPLYDELISAGQDFGAVNRDFDKVMSSPAMRAEQAINSLKIAIADAFTPERIAKFTAALEAVLSTADKILSALGRIGDYWDDTMAEFANPFDQRSVQQRVEDRITGNDAPASANEDMYRSKIRDITSRSSREERIREALTASSSQGDLGGQQGVRLAGKAYLDRMPAAQVERVRNQMSEDSVRGFTTSIAAELASALKGVQLVVKMDGSEVAKTVSNAPSKRGGG